MSLVDQLLRDLRAVWLNSEWAPVVPMIMETDRSFQPDAAGSGYMQLGLDYVRQPRTIEGMHKSIRIDATLRIVSFSQLGEGTAPGLKRIMFVEKALKELARANEMTYWPGSMTPSTEGAWTRIDTQVRILMDVMPQESEE